MLTCNDRSISEITKILEQIPAPAEMRSNFPRGQGRRRNSDVGQNLKHALTTSVAQRALSIGRSNPKPLRPCPRGNSNASPLARDLLKDFRYLADRSVIASEHQT